MLVIRKSRLVLSCSLFFGMFAAPLAVVDMTNQDIPVMSKSWADKSIPADDSDPHTAITTPQQQEVVNSFTGMLHDYEAHNINALRNDVTLQARDFLNSTSAENLIDTSTSDVANRGVGRLINPRVLVSGDQKYAWLRTRINYSKGGSNTILVFMVKDGMRWKVASIELT